MRTIERPDRGLALWLIPLCLLGCSPPRTRTVRTAPDRLPASPRWPPWVASAAGPAATTTTAPAPPAPPAPRAAAPPAAPADIVAVFDLQLDTPAVKTQITALLRDYLAVQLTAVGYRVVPRGQIRQRLIDAKKQTYRDCFDQLCQIELGKALAADKSLSTRLVTLEDGGGCMITSVLYDLKTEVAERAASVRTSCSGVALFAGIDTIARTLRGRAAARR